MQVFPEVDHFIFKFDHPFVVEALVLEAHLFFHQEDRIDGLVFLVVILRLFGEDLRLLDEGVDGIQIGPCVVDFPQCLFIELQVFLKILQVVVSLESLPLQELDLVLLGLVGDQDLLNVANVVVLHWV